MSCLAIDDQDPARGLELADVRRLLAEAGQEQLLALLHDPDSRCLTKSGRLNKSALGRALGLKSKQVEALVETLREVLGDWALDQDE